MNPLSIKIQIAEREYTLKVEPQDEQRIRKAAQLLGQFVKQKKEKSRIQDRQDLLAFVAFDFVYEKLLEEEQRNEAEKRLSALDELISKSL